MNTDERPLVLIVDDTSQNLQIAGEILSRENYRIALAQSGAEAIKFIETKKPDLILLDIMMPGMNGFKVCEYIKENVETRFIPIIFLTARAQIEDIVKGFELGGVDFLTKPFSDKELLVRVRSQIELIKLHEVLRTKNRKLLEEIRIRQQREKDLISFQQKHCTSLLLSGMVHEINNLLQVISGYSDLLLEKLPDNTGIIEMQDSIMQAGERIQQIVESVIIMPGNSFEAKIKTINLNQFFMDRASLFRSIFPEDIELSLIYADRPLFVNADSSELSLLFIRLLLYCCQSLIPKSRLQLILGKLISDRIFSGKFQSPENVEYAIIQICACRSSGSTTEQESIFKADSAENELKIKMLKDALKKLEGFMELDISLGNVNSVYLYIPLREEFIQETETAEILNPVTPNNGKTILLAEDDENVLFFEQKILEKEGFEIIIASNGKDAVELFQLNSEKISLVLLDISMPIKNGIEAGKEIRKLRNDVPIIYCTGFSDNNLLDKLNKDQILRKPFKRNEILAIIEEQLRPREKPESCLKSGSFG